MTLAGALTLGNITYQANAEEPYENSNAYSMYANQDWNGYSGIFQEPTPRKTTCLPYIVTPTILLVLGLNYWSRSKMSKSERGEMDKLGAF